MLDRLKNPLPNSEQINRGTLLLRMLAGGFMLIHGIPKLMKLLSGNFEFADPIGIGPAASLILTVIAEFICAIAIIVGFRTRFATIPLMITMLVAAFVVHGADPWRKKEMALLYFFMYLVLFFLGSGKYSLDMKLRGNKNND